MTKPIGKCPLCLQAKEREYNTPKESFSSDKSSNSEVGTASVTAPGRFPNRFPRGLRVPDSTSEEYPGLPKEFPQALGLLGTWYT
jgi:hypothetical protein